MGANMQCDLLIKNGTLIDGTGAARREADIAVKDGRIVAIGKLQDVQAKRVIDAKTRIVAPGVIDIHTHYDAPIHWDPYATSSSWHGTTSIVMGNCGFGYAPARLGTRERIMQMMVRTEQIPYQAQSAALNWEWESFPEWMDHLKRLPKGVNLGMYLPMNPLLLYVKGEDAKMRPTTPEEHAKMRELLHAAMDAGACGFSFSLVGGGNGHVDFDGTPVPTDLMDPEDAYNLARVLRERGDGIIQSTVQIRNECRQEITEELARISGRPIIHNCIAVYEHSEQPTEKELFMSRLWENTLAWAERMDAKGYQIYLQAVSSRSWIEFKIEEMTLFNSIPVFEDFAQARSNEARMALATDPDWRRRAREAYRFEYFITMGGGFEKYKLANAHGEPTFSAFEGQTVGQIAKALDRNLVDTFFDVLVATEMQTDFRLDEAGSRNGAKMERVLRHKRTLCGISDGGAHVKMFVGSQYPTDLINWMVKEDGRMSLEELHQALSQRPAEALSMHDRGVIAEGKAADIIVYDYDKVGYDMRYELKSDLPGGDWRQTLPARGMEFVIVNGEVILEAGRESGAFPGAMLAYRFA